MSDTPLSSSISILGIVCSPHREGLTATLVQAVLDGAGAAGAETRIMYLSDYTIEPCRGCRDADCWDTGRCRYDAAAEQRNKALGSADAVVFAAPVYMHDLAGIAKDFVDKVRVPPRANTSGPFLPTNGKPALGITVAGGTGKGALTSLQAIYYGLFFICGFRGVQPMPVTRFNHKSALAEAGPRGRGLVQAAKSPAPFRENGLADRLAYYQSIEIANSDPIADNLYLAELLISDLGRHKQLDEYREADQAVRRARHLIESGPRRDAAGPVWEAYQLALAIWEKDG